MVHQKRIKPILLTLLCSVSFSVSARLISLYPPCSMQKVYLLCLTILTVVHRVVCSATDLPFGVVRGPLLHEHSFQSPIVSDWWDEGVPHFMVGGSAIANEKFLRLTTNNLDAHGFAFNTAPMDHENWEIRMRFSVRPPPPAVRVKQGDTNVTYQGGDGFALWYLEKPIGDDHQHVLKYSKPITEDIGLELRDKDNPWRMLDTVLSDTDELNRFENIPEEHLTEDEKEEIRQTHARNELKRQRREELFRKLFKRGTSTDESDFEPRIMGVKHSDFTSGFAIVMDSVGDEAEHLAKHAAHGTALEHHHHSASISLLLNLPGHKSDSGAKILNNVQLSESNFRRYANVLKCDFDFRQAASKPFKRRNEESPVERSLGSPEEPVELIVQYYKKKLSIIVVREDATKRQVLSADKSEGVEIQHSYTETLCGEVYPLEIPQKYHFGLSASTGHRKKKDRKKDSGLYHKSSSKTTMHVDVHDVYSFNLRELDTDPKSMGYSKTIPLEHFDYAADKRERRHYSRQIPAEPDSDIPP